MAISNISREDDDLEWLGNDSTAPLIAFGDDTCFSEVLLYAFLIVERKEYENIEQQIECLKDSLKIPAAVQIHTKDFLNGHKRKKLGIERLNVAKMIDEIIDRINETSCIILYNYQLVPKAGNVYPDDLEIQGEKIHGDRKALAHILASSCFCPFIQYNGEYLTLRHFEVYVSQDKTKVKTVGNRKRQAQFLSELRIPTTFPVQKGCYARLKPHYVPTDQFLLCQIADVYAYVLSHALSKNCKNPNFKKQMRRIKNIYRAPAG